MCGISSKQSTLKYFPIGFTDHKIEAFQRCCSTNYFRFHLKPATLPAIIIFLDSLRRQQVRKFFDENSCSPFWLNQTSRSLSADWLPSAQRALASQFAFLTAVMICGPVKWQVPSLTLELLIWSKMWLCSVSCCQPSLAIAPARCHRKQLHFLLLFPKCGHNQSGGDGDKGSTGKLFCITGGEQLLASWTGLKSPWDLKLVSLL